MGIKIEENKKEENESKEDEKDKKKKETNEPFKVDASKTFDMAKKLIKDEQEEEEKIDRTFW